MKTIPIKFHRHPGRNRPITRSAIETLESRIAPAVVTTLTWQGDVDANWGGGSVATDTNWSSSLVGSKPLPTDGKSLIFPAGAANTGNVNDIAGLDLVKITITSGYNISGNAIGLSGGIAANFGGGGAKLETDITLAGDQTFTLTGAGTSQLQLGNLNLNGNDLVVDGTARLRVKGISGAGSITKTGSGSIFADEATTFTGPFNINAGKVAVFDGGAFGAAGPANATTVASGAAVQLGDNLGAIPETFIISGIGGGGDFGAVFSAPASNSGEIFNGAIRLGASAKMAAIGLTFNGAVGAADDAIGVLTLETFAGNVVLSSSSTATFELAGADPGTGYDQLAILGPVVVSGAKLVVVPTFAPFLGQSFTIIDNNGTDAVGGTFDSLPDGATISAGGVNFTISYFGGTNNNDVVLTVSALPETPIDLDLTQDGKVATFTDRDGDFVTVKTSKGAFQQTDFRLVEAGVTGGGQLQLINLSTHADDFTGAAITITAQPTQLGGNGLVNVGAIKAGVVNLASVSLAGDLGQIDVTAANVALPAVKTLTIGSLAALDVSTQQQGGDRVSDIAGTVGKIVVKGDAYGSLHAANFGSIAIAGSLIADGANDTNGALLADGRIGSVKIGASFTVAASPGSTAPSGRIVAGADLGSVTIVGDITGAPNEPAIIGATGQLVAPLKGIDSAIKSVKIGGTMSNAQILAGTGLFGTGSNADAAIGAITIGRNFNASNILAGTNLLSGVDGDTATADDVKISGAGTRDVDGRFSRIASILIKGQALGTANTSADSFGIVAEQIGKAQVGLTKFVFQKGERSIGDLFFAAPTGPGPNAELSDFTILEITTI